MKKELLVEALKTDQRLMVEFFESNTWYSGSTDPSNDAKEDQESEGEEQEGETQGRLSALFGLGMDTSLAQVLLHADAEAFLVSAFLKRNVDGIAERLMRDEEIQKSICKSIDPFEMMNLNDDGSFAVDPVDQLQSNEKLAQFIGANLAKIGGVLAQDHDLGEQVMDHMQKAMTQRAKNAAKFPTKNGRGNRTCVNQAQQRLHIAANQARRVRAEMQRVNGPTVEKASMNDQQQQQR